MRAELRQWLLDGVEPDGLDDLLAEDADAAWVAEDLAAIDAAAAELPELPLPEGLARAVLDQVAITPQEHAVPQPANRPWRWVAGLALAAVAILAVALGLPSGPDSQLDGDEIIRGQKDPSAPVDMYISVKHPGQPVVRYGSAEALQQGDALLFRAQVAKPTQVHLVMVDAEGAFLLHQQPLPPGTTDLMTEGQILGYHVEERVQSAVFALITTPEPLTAAQVAEHLSVRVDDQAVCEAAAERLDAFCDARLVQGVTP